MDLSSNFLMGLSLQFFVEVESKKKLRMVYLQVFRLMLNTYSENSCLSNSSNAEQSVEMRPMPHQATRAFSAKLADVLGRVFQGVEPSVPQVRNTTRMNPGLCHCLFFWASLSYTRAGKLSNSDLRLVAVQN